MDDKVVHSDPDIMHGTPVFVGTRVPADSLWAYLEAGSSLGDFFEDFPGVREEQVARLLQQARQLLSVPTARPAPEPSDPHHEVAP